MIEKFISFNWNFAPEKMVFSQTFSDIYNEIENSLSLGLQTLNKKDYQLQNFLISQKTKNKHFFENMNTLYLKLPALISVILDYKILIESSFKDVELVDSLYRESILVGKKTFQLSKDSLPSLKKLFNNLPEEIQSSVHTSDKDDFTWKSSDPNQIIDLSNKIKEVISPQLIIGSGHGSIRAGLLLSNLLDTDVYFIRFSQFKYYDSKPVIFKTDLDYLKNYAQSNILVLDEDVAFGRTLDCLTKTMTPLFKNVFSASVTCYRGSFYKPDFTNTYTHD